MRFGFGSGFAITRAVLQCGQSGAAQREKARYYITVSRLHSTPLESNPIHSDAAHSLERHALAAGRTVYKVLFSTFQGRAQHSTQVSLSRSHTSSTRGPRGDHLCARRATRQVSGRTPPPPTRRGAARRDAARRDATGTLSLQIAPLFCCVVLCYVMLSGAARRAAPQSVEWRAVRCCWHAQIAFGATLDATTINERRPLGRRRAARRFCGAHSSVWHSAVSRCVASVHRRRRAAERRGHLSPVGFSVRSSRTE